MIKSHTLLPPEMICLYEIRWPIINILLWKFLGRLYSTWLNKAFFSYYLGSIKLIIFCSLTLSRAVFSIKVLIFNFF